MAFFCSGLFNLKGFWKTRWPQYSCIVIEFAFWFPEKLLTFMHVFLTSNTLHWYGMIVCTQKNISPDTWYITPYLNMMKLQTQTQGQKHMSLYASMRIAHMPSVYEKGMPNKNQEQWLGLNQPPHVLTTILKFLAVNQTTCQPPDTDPNDPRHFKRFGSTVKASMPWANIEGADATQGPGIICTLRERCRQELIKLY